MSQKQHILQQLSEKRFVKVISGINNFDLDNVLQVVQAAEAAQATAVDVAADEAIVKAVRQTTGLPVFASSTEPAKLAEAVVNGADVAEIGNFDALYEQGFYLTAEDVIRLTEETIALLPEGTLLSVTVPGYLSTEAQIQLAKQLEALGATMLQTEGTSRVLSMSRKVQLLSAEDKIRLTLENTKALSQAVRIPVMTASGIQVDNVQQAFLAGAAAVGVGSAVNRLSSEEAMVQVLLSLMAAVQALPAQPALTKVS